MRQRLAVGLQIAILAGAYIASGKLALFLDSVSGFAAPVWPPSGIALAALLVFGYRMWPGVALGAFLVNVAAGGPGVAAVIAAGNTLEVLAATFALRQFTHFRCSLDRLGDVLAL